MNLIKNMLTLVISLLIALAIAEGGLRYFMEDKLYTGNSYRGLYYSDPNLVTEENGAVHYVPNTLVRSLAIYFNKIEYETNHHTNNLGFIHHKDYIKEDKKGILFIGDSFTASVGTSDPWLPMLDDKYPDTNLYSMGVTGTGQTHFYKLFEHFQDVLNYDTVVIMSISDDLRRRYWYPINTNSYLYFGYEKSGEKHKKFVATHVNKKVDKKTLLAPEELYLTKAYHFYQRKLAEYQKEKAKPKREQEKKLSIPQKIDLTYIAKIKELADQKNKRTIFIHLPEKGETLKHKYRYDISDEMRSMGIEYHPILMTHKFDMSMFHPHDGHPNSKGYAYIANILEDILNLKK